MAEINGSTSEPPPMNPPTSIQAPPSPPTDKKSINPAFPMTSLNDSGLSKRPRDARLIHMILANLGVTAYQERVPLQLMDFAYRYTSSILQDALHLTSESYGTAGLGGGKSTSNAASEMNSITLSSLRLSIASRTHYQFNPILPKEFYHELATERNRVALPPVGKDWGIRLPPEKYCLTGVGWGLKEEWDSDEEAEVEHKDDGEEMMLGENDGIDIEEEAADERMEDFFGEGFDDGAEDKEMEDD